MTSGPNFAFPKIRRRQLKQVGKAMVVILLIASALLILYLYRAYLEGQEIRAYVGGPYSSQLLYLQVCAPSAFDGGGLGENSGTLEEQFDSCRRSTGGHPGYFIYDFNIRRSVALSKEDMELLRKYEILTFPNSVLGRVKKSQTNAFNSIIPLEDFPGFNYECVSTAEKNESSCSFAPVKCNLSSDAIQCNVFNPNTDRFEQHVIKRNQALDFLIPQGFIAGPDLFKLLKPRFFPVLERM